jgi:hypothetical protein
MMREAPDALWIPLYGLAYIQDPEAHTIDDRDREVLLREYTPEKILAIFDALSWAVEHPDYPFVAAFGEILPPMHYDQKTIVRYLETVREGMRPVVEQLRSVKTTPPGG